MWSLLRAGTVLASDVIGPGDQRGQGRTAVQGSGSVER